MTTLVHYFLIKYVISGEFRFRARSWQWFVLQACSYKVLITVAGFFCYYFRVVCIYNISLD
jgi:hypothetical protein